jgi:hypothetical protein
VIASVLGLGAENKVRPDLADLLEAELEAVQREGLLLPPSH